MTTAQIARALGIDHLTAMQKSGGPEMRITRVVGERDDTLIVNCQWPQEGFVRTDDFPITELDFRDRAGAPIDLAADIGRIRGVTK